MIDPDVLKQNVENKVVELTERLKARVADKLSGALLQKRSGRLLASIESDFQYDDDDLTGSVSSIDVPYAGILEYGGKTSAHEIVAVKAKALSFMVGGGRRFALSVHHPGSQIPRFGFLSNSLSELHGEIVSELTDVVFDTLTRG